MSGMSRLVVSETKLVLRALYHEEGVTFAAIFFFFKQKTAYEIGTGDWSSDVCLPISRLLVCFWDLAVAVAST